MDLETEPIVLAISLAAHGSLAPVAAGPARTAMAAPGSVAATSPAKSLRRPVAVPVFMRSSLYFAKPAEFGCAANDCDRRPDLSRSSRTPHTAKRHPAIPAVPLPPAVTE